jgi:transposase
MLYTNYTEKLLGIQGIEIKNITKNEGSTEISIEQKRKMCVCPVCGLHTDKIHDYRKQRVKDLPSFGNNVILILRKRRYVCSCGKRFFEPNDFLPKYQRRTQRTILEIINRLRDVRSYSTVATEFNISSSTVIRLFKNIQYPRPEKLPEVIGIDEFKGNSGGEKFHAILTDISEKKVVDILKTRHQHNLCDYFKQFERSEVKYFVSDMYKPYAEIAKTYFPKAIYVIDKYHWIRQLTWAFDAVRKEIQKQFSKQYRRYFKNSKGLLLNSGDELTDEQRRQVYIMLDISPTLSTAYFLKENVYKILKMTEPEKQKKALSYWIEEALDSDIPSFVKCAKTYLTWFTPITNSFFCPYTNGFTEGCNNKIKVLKRNAFGLHDFKRFRNRILFMFSANKKVAEA